MKASAPKSFLLNGTEVDLRVRSIRRDGLALQPRSKSFELLLYLLENRDRLVPKEELLSKLWSGTAVTEDSLVQCVLDLRKALGDEARHPRFIRNVPKVGYQLIATVEEMEPPALDHLARLEIEEVTTRQVEYEEEVLWERPVSSSPREPPPTAGRKTVTDVFGHLELPSGRGKRWIHWSPWTAAAALAASLAAGWLAFWGTAKTPGDLPLSEVAWWKLDDGHGLAVSDSSGHRQNGVLQGGASWVNAERGPGLWFDGLEAYVTGRGKSPLPSRDGPRTISAWIKAATPRVDDTAIFEYGSDFRGPTPQRFSLSLLLDGTISSGASVPGGYACGTTRLPDDSWHLVTATYEGPTSNMIRIFVDGKLDKAEKVGAAPATNSGYAWRIGRSLLGRSAFRGVIDDVRVYNRALEDAKVGALYRCSAGIKDVGDYYYLPVFYPGLVIDDRGAEDPSTSFGNEGKDYAGVQLAKSDGACGMSSLRGADVGQDLRISVDLLVPTDESGRITEAGPFFRSRSARPGEGLIGGTSAGYWVQLYSTGMLKVTRLNPQTIVAFSSPILDFDPAVFHHLETEARGDNLQVWVDGELISFDQGGQRVDHVAIRPAWEGPPRIGQNQGAAGIAFGAAHNRREIGGQRARRLVVSSVEPPTRLAGQ